MKKNRRKMEEKNRQKIGKKLLEKSPQISPKI
jgi:hypothetical protein